MTDATIALDHRDAGNMEFSLLLDRSLRLSLPNLYSAGYKWDVVADEAALSVEVEGGKPAAEADLAVGSAPPVVFCVRALVPGAHDLALELRRPWESAPAKVVHVTVRGHRPTLLDGFRPRAA